MFQTTSLYTSERDTRISVEISFYVIRKPIVRKSFDFLIESEYAKKSHLVEFFPKWAVLHMQYTKHELKTKNDEMNALKLTKAKSKMSTMQPKITTIKCIERKNENKNKNNAATMPTNRNQKRRRHKKKSGRKTIKGSQTSIEKKFERGC